MKSEIVFASHNENKVSEVRKLMPPSFHVLSLSDIQWSGDLPEPFHTYAENAKAKAYRVFERIGLSCFADDSGLEIEALNGRPGVLSARYAGEGIESSDLIEKVLAELGDHHHRKASFRAVIAYISMEGRIQLFHGRVSGKISYVPKGKKGFGYDPIFVPDGFDQTFAQMDEAIKNRISHRAHAMNQFISFLEQ